MRLNALDRNGRTQNFSIAEYRDIRDRSDVFAGVVALAPLPVSLGDAVAGRAATTTTSFLRAMSSPSG